MTIVVTRDVPGRFRGFLASCMLEVAPGVYVAPRMNRGIRDRMWSVVGEWYHELGRGSLVMAWRQQDQPGNLGLAFLGEPAKSIVEHEGLFLVQRALSQTSDSDGSLTTEPHESEPQEPR